MSNPLFNQLNQNNPASMIQQFNEFRKHMQGINPKDEVMKMLQNGKINSNSLIKRNRWRNNFNQCLNKNTSYGIFMLSLVQ